MSINFYLYVHLLCRTSKALHFDRSEILSKEGTKRGDLTLIGTYVHGILPIHSLVDFVITNNLQSRELAFADYLTVAGKFADIKYSWDILSTFGPE